ncbi:MAG: RNA polymerase sigma factor [bacterium]
MDEKTTVKRIRSGDKELFALLLRKYERIVNSIIYSMVFDIETTKDLTQETFIKAFENLNSYSEEHEFKPWVIKIARNHTIDYIRKKKKTISIEELDYEIPDNKNLHGLDEMQQQKALEKAMARLKEDDRTLLIMKYKEGFSNKEIAEAMEIPENRVNVKLFRAKEKMRELLEMKKCER